MSQRIFRRFRHPFGVLCAVLFLTSGVSRPASAEAENIDRIVAVVNDEIVLASEIQEQMLLLETSQNIDFSDTTRAASARRQILDQLIEERLITDYAVKQGITITDEQVDQQVEETIEKVKAQIGTEEEFLAELENQGMSMETLRDRYRQDIRRQMLAQRIVDKEIRYKVKVTEADVDTFYANNKAEIPGRPNAVHIAHILVVPKPDPSRQQSARKRAEDILARLRKGGDWDKIAAQFSEDPSTASGGGDLGEVKAGDFDERFEAAVRDLQPGMRSGIVETRFGYHIIELVSRNEDRYRARHILILTQPSPEDVADAIGRGMKAREAVLGGQDWNEVVRNYSDDADTRDKGGDLGMIPLSRLPRAYIDALDTLDVGGLTPVLEGPTGLHVFKLIERQGGGEYNLEEIRGELTSMLTQRKLAEEYDRWIANIRKKAFVDVKGF